jgi:CRP-like cAMP-binding protein
MGSGDFRPGNKLLRALDDSAYRRLARRLRAVPLSARLILYRANEPIQQIYFPETAVVCFMAVMRDGSTIESATVGVEGASWLSSSVGIATSPCETIVAVGGSASVLDIDDFNREVHQNEQFSAHVHRQVHALLLHSLHMTACTGLHSLEQRCARWFLIALDRVS